MDAEKILIVPQPPAGIKYMLGNESWLPESERTPLRLSCEEWGNLGPMELNSEIQPNAVGFRVRHSEFLCPEGYNDFLLENGSYFWVKTSR